MDILEVRVFNVGFGDAILVTVPETGRRRHILFDVGNVLSGEGGGDEIFAAVFTRIEEVLSGDAVDLYVMTHEHLDHVQGMFHLSARLGRHLDVRHAWLTASAAPDYYERFEDAKVQRRLAITTYGRIARYLAAADDVHPAVDMLRRNNDMLAAAGSPSSTRQCVEHLRTLATESTVYVDRTTVLPAMFDEAVLTVWAPEPDTSDYYGRFQPMALGPDPGDPDLPDADLPDADARVGPAAATLPPPGVDGGAFYDLVESRRRGIVDNLLTIDKAANNTSMVLCLEWRGWRLLFPGDAETRSWRTMRREGVLRPVHFLKVGHHGSHNGTPAPELLDLVLPLDPPDGRPRSAAVSTHPDSYDHVPHQATIDLIATRCAVRSTAGLADGAELLFEFPAE